MRTHDATKLTVVWAGELSGEGDMATSYDPQYWDDELRAPSTALVRFAARFRHLPSGTDYAIAANYDDPLMVFRFTPGAFGLPGPFVRVYDPIVLDAAARIYVAIRRGARS